MDKTFLKNRHPDVEIFKIASSLQVRGVDASKHVTSEYVTIPIHIPDVDKAGDTVLACIRRGFYLVEDLRTNVLTGNNIISPQAIAINITERSVFISSCGELSSMSVIY